MASDILYIFLQDESEYEDELKQRQDEFLDIYSLYQETKLPWVKEELLAKAYQIHLLDPNFTFQV